MGGRKQFICVVSFWAAAVLLSGCSGGSDDPTPTASEESAPSTSEATAIESTSAAPTAEPTESVDSWAAGPPAVTWEMRLDDEAGAIAFVEYYVDLLNYSYAKLDTSELERVSDDDCVGCNSIIESIGTVVANEYVLSGGHSEVIELSGIPESHESSVYHVDMILHFEALTIYDQAGTELDTSDELQNLTGFTVRYLGPCDWTMISMGFLEG